VVSAQVYTLVLTVAAATLAAWLGVCVPSLVPRSMGAAWAWAAAALACGVAAPPLVVLITRELGPVAAATLVMLPTGVCVFLAVGFAMLFVVRALETSR
jgi:hypothetical protein